MCMFGGPPSPPPSQSTNEILADRAEASRQARATNRATMARAGGMMSLLGSRGYGDLGAGATSALGVGAAT